MKAVVAAFNQEKAEKALVGAFSVITNIRMELFEALVSTLSSRLSLILASLSRMLMGVAGARSRSRRRCGDMLSPGHHS